MAAVLDAPVAAIDAVGDVEGGLAGLLLNRFSLNEEGLLYVGEVEVWGKFGGGPDFTGFDSAMIRGIVSNEIRFLPILEIQLDILKECGLIALQIDGVEQWDGHPDFVGALEFFIVSYGQGTDFFWV